MQPAIGPAYQACILQSLAKQTSNSTVNLHHRIQLPNILPGAEFVNVFLKMFRTHLVVDTVVAALQAAPKRFSTVDVRLIFNIFANRVLDTLMRVSALSKTFVGSRVILYRQLNLPKPNHKQSGVA